MQGSKLFLNPLIVPHNLWYDIYIYKQKPKNFILIVEALFRSGLGCRSQGLGSKV